MSSTLNILVVLCILKTTGLSVGNRNRSEQAALRRFPDEFFFGAATSAYQIEGAWNEGGKGWSIWDHFVRTKPQTILDQANGDIAADSYHFYKNDVEILKELGVQVYRFSIAWARILPYGRPDYINPEGVSYYNNLIDELLANDITPFVTMYHWDLPQNLQEQGGWLTEDIVQWFGDYSRVLFKHFGGRVKHWITINEPHIHCYYGYTVGLHAPGISAPEEYYNCGRHILLAHAQAYHIYDQEFRPIQGGEIGITLDIEMGLPASNSQEDQQAFQDYMDFYLGHYADPLLSESGNYPQRFIKLIDEASKRQGLPESRLKPFTEDEIKKVKGTSDFLGVNHYSSNYVYRNSSVVGMHKVPSILDDAQIGTYKDPSWPVAETGGWTRSYSPGMHKLLVYIKDRYNNPIIYVTENGYSTGYGLNDTERVQYYREYLNGVLDAIEDNVNIKGYCAWSLIDNFEWSFGYRVRYGLYQIDLDDPEKTRGAKKSALVYKEIVRSRQIDPTYDPDPFASGSVNLTSSCILIIAILIKSLFL